MQAAGFWVSSCKFKVHATSWWERCVVDQAPFDFEELLDLSTTPGQAVVLAERLTRRREDAGNAGMGTLYYIQDRAVGPGGANSAVSVHCFLKIMSTSPLWPVCGRHAGWFHHTLTKWGMSAPNTMNFLK